MPNFNRNPTAGDVINSVAVQCGLARVTDPYTSTDVAFQQLVSQLTDCGRELVGVYNWPHLLKSGSIAVQYADDGPYSFPTDFDRLVSDTLWDRSGQVKGVFIDPVQLEAFSALQTVTSGELSVLYYQELTGLLVHPTPPAGAGTYQTLYFRYVSRGWVYSTSAADYTDYITGSDDTLYFDSNLLIKRLKLAFLGSKGFDTTIAAAEAQAAYDAAIGRDLPATKLTLVPPCVRFPLNVPDTGYGS